MLNKRMHVLFDENDYLILESLAKEMSLSVGEVVRKTVQEMLLDAKKRELAKGQENLQMIDKLRKKMKSRTRNSMTAQDLKNLVEYGRKY